VDLENFLQRLNGVRPSGAGYAAFCPGHADKNQSLSISNGDGKILAHCFAGCTVESILAALNLEMRDLFTDGANATTKQERKQIAVYDYLNERGEVLYQNVRYEPKDFRVRRPDGHGGYIWSVPREMRTIYNLPAVIDAKYVLWVEGEKDVHAAKSLGFVATTSGGATSWQDRFAPYLAGKNLAIIKDADEPGHKHAQEVARGNYGTAESIAVLELPGGKDLAEWVEKCGTHDKLFALIEAAPQWKPPVLAGGAGAAQVQVAEPAPEPEPDEPEDDKLPEFPKIAWRGVFKDYRVAMDGVTEASDVVHFAACWTRVAVALGRNVSFFLGMPIYPNTYLVCFGDTGDKKTTALRYVEQLGVPFHILRGAASGEGMADAFSVAKPGESLLILAEEFSQILRPGRWDGATLIPFLTTCFDCPPRYEMKYRKSPVDLDRPTPSLFACTTPDWFWREMRVGDFAGGFGNRTFFFTGAKQPPIPLPNMPNLTAISSAIDALAMTPPTTAIFDVDARSEWVQFYIAWCAGEKKRDPLLRDAVKRIPSYVIKLGMAYAALEGTLPEITRDQLDAAIAVGKYGVECTKELLSLQNSGTNPRKELEQRILAKVAGQPNGRITKNYLRKLLHRHFANTEEFNRTFDSLVRATALFAGNPVHGQVWVARKVEDL
jgi:hypothetical protein